MGRPPLVTLRPFTQDEQDYFEMISRAQTAPAVQVARAKMLLAVADGHSFKAAARLAGYRDGDTVTALIKRFNEEGPEALIPRHGGGHPTIYTADDRQRILAEARRQPDPQTDGTHTWSLTTLQRALRNAPDGLPDVSTYTIWKVLHEAGFRWVKDRSWCETGRTKRKRKSGAIVQVIDEHAEQKKTD